MQKISRALLFWTLILCACTPTSSSTDTGTPNIDPDVVDQISDPTPTFDGCGYQWTYKDLPELTSVLDPAIKQLDPNARAWAAGFGEDCVYMDGHKVTGFLETDFYIQQPVVDLNNVEAFGIWIENVMKVIDSLPKNIIVGPQPGFVEFTFSKSRNDQLIFRVPIQKYHDEANGKTGEELFRMFYEAP